GSASSGPTALSVRTPSPDCVTVAVGTVPLSLLADRWGLLKSVFVMALVWSGATIACAFAGSYGQLLVARGFVGLGEAAYGPAGAALLASRFPGRFRTGVLGAFFAASLVGSVLGVALGGAIAERWSWQAGFGIAGLPGLVLAGLFVLLVREDATAALPVREPSRTLTYTLKQGSKTIAAFTNGNELLITTDADTPEAAGGPDASPSSLTSSMAQTSPPASRIARAPTSTPPSPTCAPAKEHPAAGSAT
ncbi:MAG TPA: MFS transporter, partial [Candidatus Paceibacterota bacterium]|nr:MFS transporter [Candidatus Paceibacterota bacterium]